jgi:ferredoxin
MIRWFRQNPKRIAADLGVSLLPVEGKIKRVASRMINSCNLCGLCTAVCPVGVDTCAAMESGRRLLAESGHLPSAFHDYWMEDLAFSMSDEAYGVVSGDDLAVNPPSVLFFPGCQLTASIPDTVARTFEFVRSKEPGAAMLLACCGIPADWAAEHEAFGNAIAKLRADWEYLGRPEILYACSACKKTFEKALPEAYGRLVYEWLAANRADKTGGAARPYPAAVYDPCNSRDDKAGQAAVRTLAEGMGYALEELKLSGGDAACCGFGGHIYPANTGLTEAILDERGADAPNLPRITYCANCRDLFRYKGLDSLHILELLFPDESPGGKAALPTLSERRENRRALKTRYLSDADSALESLEPPETPFEYYNGMSLEIPLETEEKMDRLLLLREDVAKTIIHCEGKNAKAVDTKNGRSFGYHRERLVTVWAEYEISDEGRAYVHNVYSHRMEIEAGETFEEKDRKAAAAEDMICARCGVPLEPAETKFSYLGHAFSHPVPKCPVCGQVYISEELVNGKISEVEALLEDK